VILRIALVAIAPALAFGALIWLSDRNREPLRWVLGTFGLSFLFAAIAAWLERRALLFTGLDWTRSEGAGTQTGALVFLFGFAAPLREACKVCATWPAYRSKYFDEAYDGVVYAGAAGLGFAALDNAVLLYDHPVGGMWVVRALLALPAHVFFACSWGYALGLARKRKDPGPIFPLIWIGATFAHGLYYLFCIRSAEAFVLGTLPILLVMGVLSLYFGRDLLARDRGRSASKVARYLPRTPKDLSAIRGALSTKAEPFRIWAGLAATLVNLGGMLLGLAAAVGFAHAAHVDFSTVDAKALDTAGPMALLGAGTLAAFPVSGFMLARASTRVSIAEPTIGAAMAIVVGLLLLGASAPLTLFVGMAFAPVAWGLAFAGAWVGRPSS
jgi:RsiW-degrading membrane proteinase PrsW (M82 family)